MVIPFCNLRIFFKTRPEYENINYFRNSMLDDYEIDDFSLDYLKKINLINLKKLKNNEYLKWKNFAKNNNLKPVFKEFDHNLIPWCFPAYVKDNKEAIKWFNWGWKNNVNIFSWPTLPNEVVLNNKIALDRWKRMICFSLKKY